MKKKTKVLSVALLIVGITCGSALAVDYQSMTNEELAAMRGTMRETSLEEQTAFRNEWQNRVNKMSPEEKAQAIGKPEGAARDGKANQSRNRNQNRQMSQVGASGAPGMGVGSSQGMGRAGRGRR